jgi:hypothetical protein
MNKKKVTRATPKEQANPNHKEDFMKVLELAVNGTKKK